MRQRSPNLYNTYPTVAFLDCRWRCQPLPLEHTTPLFDTVLYLYIYLYTISSCLVTEKKITEGQQKEQLELCHNHPHAKQMLMKTVMFWDLNTWLSTGLELPFSQYHSPENLSCSGLNQNVSTVHSDREVWTWNLIHRVNARFVVRWVLTWDAKRSVRALKGEEKSSESGKRTPEKTDGAPGKLRRWLMVVPGIHVAIPSTTAIKSRVTLEVSSKCQPWHLVITHVCHP